MNAPTSRAAQSLADALHTMTPEQKRNAEIVRDLCRRIEQEVIAKIPRMPAEWDGHELRLYLSHKFAREVPPNSMNDQRDRYRRRKYNNAIVQHNL